MKKIWIGLLTLGAVTASYPKLVKAAETNLSALLQETTVGDEKTALIKEALLLELNATHFDHCMQRALYEQKPDPLSMRTNLMSDLTQNNSMIQIDHKQRTISVIIPSVAEGWTRESTFKLDKGLSQIIIVDVFYRRYKTKTVNVGTLVDPRIVTLAAEMIQNVGTCSVVNPNP